MPIYAYRCESCGFAKDVLQKLSDAPLTDCLSCGQPTFKKQVTAAGFQLKGTGWYATDFKGGSTASPKSGSDAPSANSDGKSDGKSASDAAKPAATETASTGTASTGSTPATNA